jgi:hypothetical protein
MAKRIRSKSSPYKVGYGRPPKATQFKPGKSGNPKGRPKGPKSVGAVLQDNPSSKARSDRKRQDAPRTNAGSHAAPSR